MQNRILASGLVSAIASLIVGSVFGTYGAWGLLLTQSETTAGRWLIAISIGIFLAWVYSFFRRTFLVNSLPASRGVIFGLLVWLATLIIATIIEEVRIFAFKVPFGSTLFLTAILNAIWGGVLATSYESNGEDRAVRVPTNRLRR